MTFLYTVFLAALSAAAIPLLLHLLSRQRLPLIPFSTIKFLQHLQKRRSRRVQIRQLILLALRTFAVVMIVLTFARPALQSAGSTGSAAAVEMVIILDDGLNSAAQTLDGQVHRLSIERVKQLLDLAGPDDRISLIRTTDPYRPQTELSGSRELIVHRLEESLPTYVAPRIIESLQTADSIFTASLKVNRELYLAGSFYGITWDSAGVNYSDEFVRRFLLSVGPERLDNLSVSDVKLTSSIIQPGQPVELSALIRNQSRRDIEVMPLGVYIDGERVAQLSVDLPAGGTIMKSFSLNLTRSGLIEGMLKLEELDPLAVDNKRYFIIDAPGELRMMAVVPDSTERMILEVLFAAEQAKGVSVSFEDPHRWETESLTEYDVLLMAGVRSVSSGATHKIREFVENGGGVILFPGRDSDLAEMGRGVWKQLGFAGAKGTIEGGGVTWGKLDLDHPIFGGIFNEKGKPRYPRFNFCLDLALGKDDIVVVPLSNDRPFLIERVVGRGRALSFAAPLDPRSGDFVLSGIFAPMMYKSVVYAASPVRSGQPVFITGNSYELVLPTTNVASAILTEPDGVITELPPRPVIGGAGYSTGEIRLPGINVLAVSDHVSTKYASNIPTNQSKLVRSTDSDLEDRFEASLIPPSEEDLSDIIYKIRFGRELWRPFALAFLILLISETLVGRAWSKDL